MTTATKPSPDPALPAGFRDADDWQDDVPLPCRVLLDDLRSIDGVDNEHLNAVEITAVQFADGRIDDGVVVEPPRVYLGDDGLTVTGRTHFGGLSGNEFRHSLCSGFGAGPSGPPSSNMAWRR